MARHPNPNDRRSAPGTGVPRRAAVARNSQANAAKNRGSGAKTAKSAASYRPISGPAKSPSSVGGPGQAHSARTQSTSSGRPTRGQDGRKGPPRYWLRRMIAGVLALLVLAGVVTALYFLGVWIYNYLSSVEDADARATPQITAVQPLPCDSKTLGIELALPGAILPVKQPVNVGVTITNKGQKPCFVDSSSATMGLRVVSGPATTWDACACAAKVEEQMLLLNVGESWKTRWTWSGKTYTDKCEAGPDAKSGYYQFVALFRGQPLGEKQIAELK